MAVVVDASIVFALLTNHPRHDAAERLVQDWIAADSARTIEIALQLGRRSAYDAAYIALAERVGAELWALDGSLVRNARGFGFPVRLAE